VILGEDRRRAAWLLTAPTLLLYAATFAVPLGVMVVYSLSRFDGAVTTFGLYPDNYIAAFTDDVTRVVFWRTLRLALWITLACLVFGYPVALFMRRASPAMRLVIIALIVSPLLTSIIVRNVAWMLILGRTGLVNEALRATGLIEAPLRLMYNDLGVVIGVVHVYLTFMVLPIYASLSEIDSSVEESAASLGASPTRVFWSVTFPLSLPGVFAGATLVFILSMGIYLTPVIMGGNFVVTLPMIITDLVRNQYDWSRSSALAILLLGVIGLFAALAQRLQRRAGGA
jgi:putative spermidine/putrescine transport system permease protein